MRTLITTICLLGYPIVAAAQQPRPPARAGEIAAAFTKHKVVDRTKRGVRREKYKDVRAEPVVRADVRDYAGRYENTDFDWWIDLRIAADGRIQAAGADAGEFELRNVSIAGSLLTATKVYRDNRSEPFEGVFMNRIERTSPTDPGVTAFGLGVMLARPVELHGSTFDRVFYRLIR